MFSDKSVALLERMRIDPNIYHQDLVQKFGGDSVVFHTLIDFFDHSDKVSDESKFNEFWKEKFASYECGSELHNWAYEFYNNLCRFFDGGVFQLFKSKQAEWGAPTISIQREDIVDASNIEMLDDPQIIYRGLSEIEHKSKKYAQSWTTDIEIARKFAKETYSDEPEGIVVKSKIKRDLILHYDCADSEKEVIIEKDAITEAQEI
jgi:hypothetical protein